MIYNSVISIYLQPNFSYINENLSLYGMCRIWGWKELGTVAFPIYAGNKVVIRSQSKLLKTSK